MRIKSIKNICCIRKNLHVLHVLSIKEIKLMDVDEKDYWPVVEEISDSIVSKDSKNSVEEDEKIVNKTVVDIISKEESQALNVDTNTEGPVELEWDVNFDKDKDADEDGQMKIF